MSGTALIVVFAIAQVLSLSAFGAFPGLLPLFLDLWSLSGSEAGWINGLYFTAYMAAVPLLVGLTDRIDARKVYFASTILIALSLVAFAFLAEGFWSALLIRMAAGAGLAGTYMPGLKALTDRVPEERNARAVAFYTASFSVGTALSFLAVGYLETFFGWQWGIAVLAAGPLCAFLMVFFLVSPKDPAADTEQPARALDFRPVLRNRPAFSFILAYAAHSWELFALRSWIVAFLVFAQTLVPADAAGAGWPASVIAAIVIMLGLPASILGNEAAQRWGRRRVVISIMLVSALVAMSVGFLPGLPLPLVVFVLLLYGCTVTGESASVTAGALASAPKSQRGITMAAHSFIGFAGASAGPVVFGWVLDAMGGQTSGTAWSLAFMSLAAVVAVGALAVSCGGIRPPGSEPTRCNR
jgi:MFS family permease